MLACLSWLLRTTNPLLPTPTGLALTFGFLFIWALGQQFALQTVFFEESLKTLKNGRKAVLIAATIFAALHLPNPFLTVATWAGAAVWCSIYRRHPNLLPLAASHAICSMALMTAFSREVTGAMRVGYSYLAFWMGYRGLRMRISPAMVSPYPQSAIRNRYCPTVSDGAKVTLYAVPPRTVRV